MSSPGFEPRPNSTAVSVANHYTGWRQCLDFRRPHHHHSRQRGGHQPFMTNLDPTQPWDNSHRRRYRKRGHHHHHGVQLLRSVSTPSPQRGRQHHPRQFNDLWVKLDNQDKATSENFDSISDSVLKNSRKRLDSWYSASSRNEAYTLTVDKVVWLIIGTLLWSQCLKSRLEV
ncbi:uncharacterized protein TNCV_312131 [Trichonephila clavipes]|nr:uncharacterized protein TNCV_312131 [Trichonephila clavipes]